jgi:hypothetical protein
MSNAPNNSGASVHWLDRLAQNQRQLAFGLLGIGALFVALTVWLGYQYKSQLLSVTVTTGLLAAVPVIAGLICLGIEPSRMPRKEFVRMVLLATGGLVGFIAVVIGVTLGFHEAWWKVLTGGTKAWQGAERWRLWECIGILFGGFALMFASVQLGRAEERTQAALRRLVYGYNAVLTGLLLLAVLAVVNVLAYIYLPKVDWTTQSIYALSDMSKKVLDDLKKPTKVYVVLPEADSEVYTRVRALMENCEEINPKLFKWEFVSPDINRERVQELATQYNFNDRLGLLVVSGEEPNVKTQSITIEALFGMSGSPMSRQDDTSRFFKGESELINAIDFLEQDKKKTVIYFTQGNEELDLNDLGSQRELDKGLGSLKRRLEEDNFVVKGLQLTSLAGVKAKNPDTLVAAQVPTDASATLTGSMDEGTTSVKVAANTDFPAKAPFKVQIGDEKMSVTDGAGTATWTVTRGEEGSKRAAHNAGDNVQLIDPSPADIVVIAGPRRRFAKDALDALKNYVDNKKGKLIVLLDVPLEPDPRFEPSGLEEWLAPYGVKAESNRILSIPQGRGSATDVVANVPASGGRQQNPITAAFRRFGFVLMGARTIQSNPPPPDPNRPMPPRYNAEVILEADPRRNILVDTNLQVNPLKVLTDLNQARKLGERLSPEPLPLAVAVSEQGPGDPTDPHAFMNPKSTPRMIVFGDATFLCNAFQDAQAGDIFYNLFSSSLAWLKERAARIAIPAKKNDNYQPDVANVNLRRMILLPGFLVLLCIVGLGAGVWVVRRK